MLPKESVKMSLNDRLKALINQAPVMLFMKGAPGEPKCGLASVLTTGEECVLFYLPYLLFTLSTFNTQCM
mgnify:CR=1 FL=1